MLKHTIEAVKKQNEQHEFQGIFRMLLYRHFSVPVTSILAYTGVSPNTITTISLILAFVAAAFYYRSDYTYLIIGTIILNISLILDYVDGELARYKGLSSVFGSWWDSVCDRVTEYVIISSLILGLYFKNMSPSILILGIFAIANLMMMSTVRSLTRLSFNMKQKHEINLGKRFYLAGADTFVVLVTITALLNKVYYLLIIYAVLGAAVWIKQIHRAIISFKTN